MLLLHYCVSTANLTKNIFAHQSQRILANFMHILGLRRTRCMYDVSATYLWHLHEECAAYSNDQNKTASNRIRSATWIRKVRHRYAVSTLYTTNVRRIWNYKERHGNATASKAYVHVAVALHDRLVRLERHDNA